MFNVQIFFLTLQKVSFLLVVILVGYLLFKSKKIERKTANILSFLSTTVFSPAYILDILPDQFTVKNLNKNLWIFLLSVALIFVTVIVARLLAKSFGKDDFEKNSLTYAFAFANTGYFGYPVIQGVFGDELLAQFMVFCIPLNMTIFSYGYKLFMPKGEKSNLKKLFFSPVMISYYVGMLMGLTGLRFPSFLDDAVSAAASCMSPVCMLAIGIVLASFPLKHLLSDLRSYLFSLFRLVFIPVIFGLALYFVGLRENFFVLAMASLALPVGLNMVIFPESMGFDSSRNAKICFLSILLSIITLPFVFAVVKTVAGI